MKQGNVLVVNCGSSSVKFAVIAADTGAIVAQGVADRLISGGSTLKARIGDATEKAEPLGDGADHHTAMLALVRFIRNADLDDTLFAVGHRVVHGGEAFAESVLINPDVIAAISANRHLAPLHNPANLKGIGAAQTAFPTLPQVAVFDTSFHQSMPATAFLYALPYELYSEHGIRRYGFHGSSHRYVSAEAAKMLGKNPLQCNVISAHLGNGCSVCAVQAGKSVDTSMGLTPLEGLVMGTRTGDLDPSVGQFLQQHLGYTVEQVNEVYNNESGLQGLSGLSNDCRSLEKAATQGNHRAQLALDIFCYRLAKYIASYTVAVNPLDALVLTGGIGENSSYIRATVLNLLRPLGFRLSESDNDRCRFGVAGCISLDGSPKALVIPTNEEWVIAMDAARLALN